MVGVADGMFDRGGPSVSRKIREIDEELTVGTPREIVIETDLAGLAQEQTLPGLPVGLCPTHLPE